MRETQAMRQSNVIQSRSDLRVPQEHRGVLSNGSSGSLPPEDLLRVNQAKPGYPMVGISMEALKPQSQMPHRMTPDPDTSDTSDSDDTDSEDSVLDNPRAAYSRERPLSCRRLLTSYDDSYCCYGCLENGSYFYFIYFFVYFCCIYPSYCG